MISIVNYGMGNLGSIVNMYKKIGVKTEFVSTIAEIERAEKILLPGVGSFDAAITKIDELGLRQVLNKKALEEKIPILGICLGMQLLTKSSEEGRLSGLGWIDAKTLAFNGLIDTSKFKIPHMGWNTAEIHRTSALTAGFQEMEDVRFYFVHSYFVRCEQSENSILRTEYGVDFDSAIQRENIYGAQFHPEKSHKFGMKLLENFARI
ncbi:imidazole glycerol phosphate synthase subunit HisH [Bdellovibrio bacteriovorus]|uniref:imidazole glycerol phosphate synthase subunit HisH n=1 Tax=Bdellovibrio bacteriovorus TaxID=959 RepID=UPI0035A8E17F